MAEMEIYWDNLRILIGCFLAIEYTKSQREIDTSHATMPEFREVKADRRALCNQCIFVQALYRFRFWGRHSLT